jgi:hypothetical protein
VSTRGVFVASRVSCCQVFHLARCKLVQNSTTLSEMSDGLITVSKHSNSTFIMLYLNHEMDVDYLVVDEVLNISKLIDHDCMFSISANL